MTCSEMPDFRSPAFLTGHMNQLIDFYYPACLNQEDGGYYNEFRDDGRITDRTTQHLVSTTRFVVNFAIGARLLSRPALLDAAAHGVRHLDEVHRDREWGGYFWRLEQSEPADASKQCYGHAFVLLAYAVATKAGVLSAARLLDETWDLLEARFWSAEQGLYTDEFDRAWTASTAYRGQNANMHMTEAMLAAYEASGQVRFLDRAELLARRVCVDLAAAAGGLVWEHYRSDWSLDWDYNRDDPKHLFRPYGYLPGHLAEWSKLLLILERHRPRDWMLSRARHLYDSALSRSADLGYGGLHYSFGPDGVLLDFDKYYWVMSEALAAAAALAVRTGEARFWQDYDRLWTYSWNNLIDRDRGGWYRVLTPDGRRYDDVKSPPAKTDYHPFGACFEILRVLGHAR